MIYDQCKIFCVFFVLGLLIGVIFDFFRAFRKTFKTNNLVIYMEDILFFIIIGILFFKCILVFALGELRFYIFVAIVFGIIVYMLTIGNVCIKIFKMILDFFKNIIFFVANIIKFPIKLISNIILKLKR